ncbi:MAG: hydrogenase nickel incorporation protein HypB [Sedimentisphaerales bacterium]|nr:hydrogenase nickel incorporation protein HypB [Sedimentisphaerales bacterium]
MKKIKIEKKILSENEKISIANSFYLAQKKVLCLNMISSPGSGKTTILSKTIQGLKNKIRIGVIEGDIQTDIDAQRIKNAGASAIQINTEGACHLSAEQVSKGLKYLPVDELDLIIIENVGNLVCPSAFELGESGKIAVLSVAEGDDKPIKYPAVFAKSKAMLINKIDLLDHVDFDIERAGTDARKLNKNLRIFPVSAKTGEGMEVWYNWLIEEISGYRKTP